jgi:hypothetical protein
VAGAVASTASSREPEADLPSRTYLCHLTFVVVAIDVVIAAAYRPTTIGAHGGNFDALAVYIGGPAILGAVDDNVAGIREVPPQGLPTPAALTCPAENSALGKVNIRHATVRIT